MVLGIRSKSRKSASILVDYLVHVHEIKPWPPSQSLKSAHQFVLLQWENGDHNSGSYTCGVGDGKIEISESFRLPVTLYKEKSRKATAHQSFQKNNLEFHLYEPKKDKAVKGQLLGSVIVNLADYGMINEAITISAQVNCKKSSKNSAQPVLYINIQPLDRESSSSSTKSSLSMHVSLDKDGSESVSELTNEGNDEEAKIASFTDDDDEDDDDDGVSSHSSRTITSSTLEATQVSPPQNDKNVSESETYSTHTVNVGILEDKEKKGQQENGLEEQTVENISHSAKRSTQRVDVGILEDREKKEQRENGYKEQTLENISDSAKRSTQRVDVGILEDREKKEQRENGYKEQTLENISDSAKRSTQRVNVGILEDREKKEQRENGYKEQTLENVSESAKHSAQRVNVGILEDKEKKEQRENGQEGQALEVKKNHIKHEVVGKISEDAARKKVIRNDTVSFSRNSLEVQGSVRNNKLKHVKSVQFPYNSAKSNLLFSTSQLTGQERNINVPEGSGAMSCSISDGKATTNGFSEGEKIKLESKIEMLEEELRETAAVEVALYSVVAEHGSSTTKVHAPARRLSRFYLHACKGRSAAKMASAARTAASGLVLVAKACGNDVPRLTFWLSNSVLLRAIISQAVGKFQLSAGPSICSSGRNGLGEKSSVKWHESSLHEEQKNNANEWEDPQTFIVALENVEAWIFTRIIESVWWQTLTPHMQPAAAKGSNSRKAHGRRYGLGDQEQGNFSVDLWKKAFKDVCERLCPLRAGGHECGCLPVLARLVMEQLVSRLDVAMFNAILRESAEEMPTDPVSDPICDSKVLPVPAGKSSFASGAQLKNSIGNWSRWLPDLFGIDDSDSPEDEASFKAFRLLHALSDLMMLPFEMLADRSTRKEVCPKFGMAVIKRVLNNFVPDEFCPDPIPKDVLEALDYEDLDEDEEDEDSITSFPCSAAPTVYQPPPAASLTGIIGEVGSQSSLNGSSVLRKSYTSDDELDELDSPITSIVIDNLRVSPSTKPNLMPKKGGGRKVVRYKLLQEVWRDGE